MLFPILPCAKNVGVDLHLIAQKTALALWTVQPRLMHGAILCVNRYPVLDCDAHDTQILRAFLSSFEHSERCPATDLRIIRTEHLPDTNHCTGHNKPTKLSSAAGNSFVAEILRDTRKTATGVPIPTTAAQAMPRSSIDHLLDRSRRGLRDSRFSLRPLTA